jgi:large subunit ribosomal protein L21
VRGILRLCAHREHDRSGVARFSRNLVMYAIVKHGGHQYRVSAGDRLLIDRIAAEIGSTVTLESVLLLADGDRADVGNAAVADATVTATVIAHRRGRKLRVFTFKPKKRHRRTLGYRSQLTELRVEELGRAGEKTQRSAAAKPAKPAAKPVAAKPAPAEASAKRAPEASAKPAPAASAKPAPAASAKPEPAASAKPTPKAGAKPATAKRSRTKEPADGA